VTQEALAFCYNYRKVLRIARELFAATLEENHSTKVIIARAKLRSICGAYNDQPRVDRKMWKLTAWFYLGLHYDVVGDEEESRECMKMALRLCPNGNADDVIHILPLLHMSRRDLFDDDEFEEAPNEALERKEGRSSSASVRNSMTSIRTDPIFIESIRKSISRMSFVELQDALKARGLKFHDSKRALGEKLFRSLLEDSGLDI
jgi:tetratricopeptide (TPR) repeat protein